MCLYPVCMLPTTVAMAPALLSPLDPEQQILRCPLVHLLTVQTGGSRIDCLESEQSQLPDKAGCMSPSFNPPFWALVPVKGIIFNIHSTSTHWTLAVCQSLARLWGMLKGWGDVTIQSLPSRHLQSEWGDRLINGDHKVWEVPR